MTSSIETTQSLTQPITVSPTKSTTSSSTDAIATTFLPTEKATEFPIATTPSPTQAITVSPTESTKFSPTDAISTTFSVDMLTTEEISGSGSGSGADFISTTETVIDSDSSTIAIDPCDEKICIYGTCVEGVCICLPGFVGETCEEIVMETATEHPVEITTLEPTTESATPKG